MKKLFIALMLCLPLMGMAKEKNDNTDPKYLAGAITMTDGKVTFSKDFNVPGASKSVLYSTMKKWADGRFQPNEKMNARVVYENETEGTIAVMGEEYLVFSSTALSLDRTRIYYALTINVKDDQCDMTMNRIKYWYDEARNGGERYTAEEWITDDMALNKKRTKLAPICGKFRRETIDLKDQLFQSVANVLGVNSAAAMTTKAEVVQPAPAVVKLTESGVLKDISVAQIPSNLNEVATQGRITLTAGGEEIELKANNWAGLGKLFNKDVAYLVIDQSRIAANAVMANSETYTISFYPKDGTQALVVIKCKKSMTQKMTAEELKALNQPAEDGKQYNMYTGEITNAQMRQ